MPTTSDFLIYTQWVGIAALVFAALTAIAFLLKWGIRFRLVGVTGFTAVLTGGLFALSLVPLTREVIPGAVRYSTVYDNGATQAVITVPIPITEPELTATLQQASSDLFSYGRLGTSGANTFLIRARTVLHPSTGVSQPLYLGEVQRSLSSRDADLSITLYKDNLAKLPPAPASSQSNEM